MIGVDHRQIEVAVDGVEALAYLFCTGRHSARDIEAQPQVVMLDMHLPKVGGDEVFRRRRAEPATFFVPVVMFTFGTVDPSSAGPIAGSGASVT